LLAASIPARPDERVLEGGTGSGAGLLCLAARVPGIEGVGREIDAAMAALARRNFAANGMSGLTAAVADVTAGGAGEFDHAFANPPWHHHAGTPSPDPDQERARRACPGLLEAWARGLAAHLRGRGTLTLLLPAARLPEGLGALQAAGCGSLAVLPLWPKPGRAAKLMLLRGIRGGRGPATLLPGLVLHQADGRFTDEADAVLRGGAALPL
jgi:tRNA1Val (adenine37-N6)-methyltransferase